MSNVLYFISEIPSLYVFVWEGGSSWHNHLPKCAKIHFSEFQILKFSWEKPPVLPMGGGHPPPMPPPLRQRCVEGAEAPCYIALMATQFHSPPTLKFGENPGLVSKSTIVITWNALGFWRSRWDAEWMPFVFRFVSSDKILLSLNVSKSRRAV